MSELPHRPYSLLRNQPPSVTTILSMLPKPGVPWAAAKEAAMFAVLHGDKWKHLPDDEAIEAIRKHPFGIWDGRAANGTLVHSVLESYCNGENVDLEKLIDRTIETDRNARTWKHRDPDDLVEMVLGYVLGIEAWLEDFQPRDVRSETVVRWPNLWIGQTDLRCLIDGEDWLWDLKSSHQQDDDKGVYGDSYALQLCMYGMARETVSYRLEDAPQLKRGFRVVETGTGPWSRPDRYGIIHLRGDERYTAYEVDVTRDIERTALRLARAYHGWKEIPERPRIFERRIP